MKIREQIMNIPMNNRTNAEIMGTGRVMHKTVPSKIPSKETEYFYTSALDEKVPKE